jgi:hypothetical protein
MPDAPNKWRHDGTYGVLHYNSFHNVGRIHRTVPGQQILDTDGDDSAMKNNRRALRIDYPIPLFPG